MPGVEEQLPLADRWAVALYASTLRLPRPAGDVPASLRAFPTTGKLSDDSILAALGLPGSSEPASVARVAAVRAFASNSGKPVTASVFELVGPRWSRPSPWRGREIPRRGRVPSTLT